MLSLEELMDDTEALANVKFLPKDVFQLVGKKVESWLMHLLSELGVDDSPKIMGKVDQGAKLEGRVYIAEGATVEHAAYIQGPCYIGPDSQVRHAAYVRGRVYVGKGCVVGHCTEVKDSCFLDGSKAGHFAYVGDSLLTRDVNLGAGTKLANLKFKANEIKFKHPKTSEILSSGLRKFGALVGENAQTGCNSVLGPGSILCPGTMVLPNKHFRGTLTQGIY